MGRRGRGWKVSRGDFLIFVLPPRPPGWQGPVCPRKELLHSGGGGGHCNVKCLNAKCVLGEMV